MELTVSEAAKRLGVSRQRVHALLHSGDLPARWLSGRWLLDGAGIEGRATSNAPLGKPLAPHMAWGLINLAEDRAAPWLNVEQRSRLKRRLRSEPTIDQFAAWVRQRNRVLWLRGHSSVMARIRQDRHVVLSGASARRQPIVDSRRVEVYVSEQHADLFIEEHALRTVEPSRANVILRIPRGAWPFSDEVGPIGIAMDLWEASDERSKRAAVDLYQASMKISSERTEVPA